MTSLTATKTLNISTSFKNGDSIPTKYTCEGVNINPPLALDGIPSDAKSLALIVEDPDAPQGVFVHWLVWNIIPTKSIPENSILGVTGMNSFKTVDYKGPCPPAGKDHHYFFRVYALDTLLDLDKGSNVKKLKQAIEGHIIAYGEIIGIYRKTSKTEAK
jgi:Raf kinase inhibitor-like YbhB/YbcL family protein